MTDFLVHVGLLLLGVLVYHVITTIDGAGAILFFVVFPLIWMLS